MTANNNWPGKPGVPPQDGVYWLKHNVVRDKQPCLYEKGRWYCCGSDIGLSPMRCAARYSYIGPVLTPDEAAALQARADQAALGHAREADRADRSEFLHKQEIDALQKRVAELEGALRPFANVGEFIAKHHPDPETDQNHETATLVRHFRNAHNTLAGGKDE